MDPVKLGLSCFQEHHGESERSPNGSIEEMVRGVAGVEGTGGNPKKKGLLDGRRCYGDLAVSIFFFWTQFF